MAHKKTSRSFQTQALTVITALVIGFLAGRSIELPSFSGGTASPTEGRVYIGQEVVLPPAQTVGSMSVEETMQNRRSRRAYTEDPVTLLEVSQILWALQGQTADWGGRTVPSAKGGYPLHVTVVAKKVDGLPLGVYHYSSETHALNQILDVVPVEFDEAAVQGQNKSAPVAFVVSGDYSATAKVFDGESHDENVVLEAGHAGQNAYLQVESLGLGTVVSGGFNKNLMKQVLKIPGHEDLFYLIPVGVPDAEADAAH